MRLSEYILTGILIIAVSVGGSAWLQYRGIKKDLNSWKYKAIQNSQLYTNEKQISWKATQELAKIKVKNEDLADQLKDAKQRVNYLAEINGTLQDSILNLQTTPITIIDPDDSTSIIEARNFEYNKNGFLIVGYYKLVEPYLISFTKLQADIQLTLTVAENKDHTWISYVNSENPNFLVSDIKPVIKPYEPGFWEKLQFGLGAYGSGSQIGIMAGARYNKHNILLMMGTQGGTIGYYRTFTLRR